MASTQPTSGEATSPVESRKSGDTPFHTPTTEAPVEMVNLAASQTPQTVTSRPGEIIQRPQDPIAHAPAAVDSTITQHKAQEAGAPPPSVEKPVPANPSGKAPPLNRMETEAIGPSSEHPVVKADPAAGPTVLITLLLTSGARHPYKIDDKYLKKRSVTVEGMDPYLVSVYTLKELIWRDWREEWEPRPTSPSAIRLIHFGRMLDDKSTIKDCRFQTEIANVVHMTIKPQELIDEEDAKTGKGGSGRDRGDGERSGGCRCVIL